MKRTATTMARRPRAPARLSKKPLAEMIEESTVDAHDESEQAAGPSVDLRESNQIIALCVRGRDRQAISVVDLPLPSPKPAGNEWIEAYRGHESLPTA